MKSTHECPVVEMKLSKHPNADKLSVVSVADGLQVVVNTEQWNGITKAIFVPGQNYVPLSNPLFHFLKNEKKPDQEFALVKYCKLRGIRSDGICVPAPNDAVVGENYAEKLGVVHKEDEPEEQNNDCVGGPPHWVLTKYDVDGPKNYIKEFVDGETVIVTQKIHGQNSRFLWADNQLYIGTRTRWLKENAKQPTYKAVNSVPTIVDFCKAHPQYCLYGETYGFQGKYNYGLAPGACSFVAFDIRKQDGGYLDYDIFSALMKEYKIPEVPTVYYGPWNKELMVQLADETPNLLGGKHEAEGIVIKPIKERQTRNFSRLMYKIISSSFKG